MTESLRDRVQTAVQVYLDSLAPTPIMPDEIPAQVVTDVVFEAMAGARPCVTCGKGIGPAKVEKGYVQCYDCTRRRPVSILHPVFSNRLTSHPEEFRREVLGTWTDD